MKETGDVIINAVAGAGRAASPRDGDFRDEEGFLHCGRCGEKKETEISLSIGGEGRTMRVGCVCRCERQAREKQEEEQKKKEAETRMREIRKASLMDSRFYSATFQRARENPHNAKNLRICRNYAGMFQDMVRRKQGLLFWGDVGTGKSFGAACIANALMDRGVPVVMTSFVKAVDLFMGKGDAVDGLMNALSTFPLIVFDDLGAERSTEYAIEKVYDIIDSRYRSGLPMIVTTNMTMKEMLGDGDMRYRRIYDRIFEMCYPVQWTGPSWRKAEAGGRFEQIGKLLGGD